MPIKKLKTLKEEKTKRCLTDVFKKAIEFIDNKYDLNIYKKKKVPSSYLGLLELYSKIKNQLINFI